MCLFIAKAQEAATTDGSGMNNKILNISVTTFSKIIVIKRFQLSNNQITYITSGKTTQSTAQILRSTQHLEEAYSPPTVSSTSPTTIFAGTRNETMTSRSFSTGKTTPDLLSTRTQNTTGK